jgi:putative iron-dependent peroxidase
VILRVDPAAAREAVARAIAELPKHAAKVATLDARAKLVSAVSIGSELWDRLSPGARPQGLHAFRAVNGPQGSAPSTGGDLLLHVLSKREDLNVELSLRARAALGAAATVIDEVQGFRYLDSRDLTGFIDGTENPKGRERADAALIGSEDKAFAGGSYAFTQRYVHDLARWATVPVAEQEKIIGRKKRDSKELAKKPETAHIARTVIEEDGEELEILRHSFPYSRSGESGLFFIAYTRDLAIPEKMLSRMLGTAGDGLHDRLMEYSRAVSGASFFTPSLATLKALAKG